MKRSLNNLSKYSLLATDGTKGKVLDFLFDEEAWVIRYAWGYFAGLETSENKGRVLIPVSLIDEVGWQDKCFCLKLDKKDLESSPGIDEHAPVSREFEKELTSHYDQDPYWPYVYGVTGTTGTFYPPRPMQVPSEEVDEEEIETSLRSYREVLGYHMKGTDGRLGEVADIIADDKDWQVVYLVVDTSRWRPWSKLVVLSVGWLDQISFTNKEVSIGLETGQIKDAPEFDPAHPIAMDYEKALGAYYREMFNN